METKLFKDLYFFHTKSKVQAGEGLDEGSYPFYTSSSLLKKKTNESGFNTKALIFGTGGSASIHIADGEFGVSTDCLVASSQQEKVNIKYTYYYLFANLHILERGFKGAGLKHISKTYIENIEIPYPDLETQNKIVAVLDKAKSLIEKREKTITLYDNLLNARFSEMFGNSYKNSKHWDIVPLHEVVTDIDAGWSPVCEGFPRSNSNQYAVLKLGAISKRVFDASENKLLPPNIEIKKNIQARIGDVLFSRKNTKELVGATVYLFEDYENLLLPDTVFNLRYDKSKVSGVYLYFLFNDNLFRKTIQNLSSGAAASMLNISQEKLLNHKIPLPPITEQLAFEEFVKKINFKHLSNVRKSKDLFQQLLDSISQRAFSGKQLFDIEIELSSLINAIDVEKKDSENNIETIKRDVIFLQRLLDKLNELDFENKEQYDKAKYIVFRIMKEEENLIKQVFEDSQILLTLKNEIA